MEAWNVIGYALGAKPASIKNYRDEFDPLFPNPRAGWHKRPIRDHISKAYEVYKDTDLETFVGIIRSFVSYNECAESGAVPQEEPEDSAFAKRLITGLAAERYFEAVLPRLTMFTGFSAENTTRLGCGYDFRMRDTTAKDFSVVEVKGLKDRTGNISLTPKEHEVAGSMSNRFYLFVVKNFRETPFHEIIQNPLSSRLNFERRERTIVQVSWSTSV